MSGAARWAAALGASLLANAALAGTVWIAVRPGPPPPPEPFAARVSVETRGIAEADAVQREPGGEALREASAQAARAGTATLRESRAAPATFPATAAVAASVPSVLAAAPLRDAGSAVTASAPAGAKAAPVPPAAPRAAASAPTANALRAEDASLPSTPTAAGTPRPDAARAAAPPSVPVGPAPASSETTSAAPLAAPAIRATDAVAPVEAAYRPEAAAEAALPPRAAPASEATAPMQTLAAAQAVTTPAPSPSVRVTETAAVAAPLAAPPAPSLAAEGTPAASAPVTAAGIGPSELPTPPAPQAVPVSAPADPSVPTGDPTSAAPSSGERAPPAAATGDPARERPPPSERGTARLAWESGALAADPLSLAAAQSFMRPATLATGADPVRDGLAAALAAPPCSRLQTRYDPETGTLELRGHVPAEAMRGPLLAALAGQVGGGIPVADRMRVLPRPVCGALAGIASVGLPQSAEQDADPRIVGPDTHVRAYDYREGERLVLDLAGPDYDAFVYVDYFAADGTVIHLEPNGTVPLRRVAADEPFRVGEAAPGMAALDITIAPPFGQEIAAAFAASRPLYEGTRPVVEPAGPYLDFLRERVAAARAADPDFKGEWVYVFVATGP